MISKACKYGIRAVLFVASRKDDNIKLNIDDIAREVDAPEPFTAKILQSLNKMRIITSKKGPSGGFYLEDHQLHQPLLNVVRAIDGLTVFRECGLGLKQCSEIRPCPMHDQYKIARETLLKAFQETTIQQLADEVNQGSSFINNLTLSCEE